MPANELELSDGSTFGLRPSGPDRTDVSDGEILDNWLLVMSRAARIARERREGKRPARTEVQAKDAQDEILRLSQKAQELRDEKSTDPEVARLVAKAEEQKR